MSATRAGTRREEVSVVTREELVLRGIRLSYATIGYNSLEAIASLVAGLLAGSVALVGFGIDSLIEVSASGAAQWRLRSDLDEARRSRSETVTHPIDSSAFAFLRLRHTSRSIAPKRCGFASDRTGHLDGVEPEVLDEVRHAAEHVPGVRGLTDVRARWIGHRLHAELSITVAPELTVERGHELAKEVEHKLRHHLKFLSGVIVHVDPTHQSGETYHRVESHSHDGIPAHSH